MIGEKPLVGAPSATFWRTRRGANVRPLPFQALLLAQINLVWPLPTPGQSAK